MTQTLTIILLLLVLFGILWFLYRSTQNQINKVLRGERSLDDNAIWLRNTKPVPARVINMKETRNPEAGNITKVELTLEVQMPDGQPLQLTACWLVEIACLTDLEVGKSVEVKFDPKNPKKVFPAVPWARLWLFGK